MAPLSGSHTKKYNRDTVERVQRRAIQDTLVFLVCLMRCGGRLVLKGDMRLDFLCFTRLLMATLLRRIREIEENII